MYLEHFNLREKPFGLTPDPKFLFFSEQHREALDHLLYGIRQREGFVLISGHPGTGKTTLCRALLERLDLNEVSSSLILNPLLSEEELLRAILEDFGLQAGGSTRKELLDQLRDFLLETSASGKTAVLIIDEAQNLSPHCLEQVRLLSNLETEKEKLIQIILVGSEELPKTLELPEFRHLNQRISVRFHLRALDDRETRSYLQHRLNMAGAAGGIVFERKAYREIYRFSGGVPRLINMIADRCLLAACLAGSRTIKRIHVKQGRLSLAGEAEEQERRLRPWLRKRVLPASAALFLVTVAGALLLVPGVREGFEWNRPRGTEVKSVAADRPPGTFVRTAIERTVPDQVKPRPGAVEGTATAGGQVKPETSLKIEPAEERVGTEISKAGPSPVAAGPPSPEPGAAQGGPATRVLSPGGLTKTDNKPLPQFLYKPPYLYTVHVNSFIHRADALARERELQARGFSAWVAWVDLGKKGLWYRVLLGRYGDRGEALALTRRLNNLKEFHDARQLAVNAAVPSGPARGAP